MITAIYVAAYVMVLFLVTVGWCVTIANKTSAQFVGMRPNAVRNFA